MEEGEKGDVVIEIRQKETDTERETRNEDGALSEKKEKETREQRITNGLEMGHKKTKELKKMAR